MNAHAILSPSSASRWLSCTPSARFESSQDCEDSSLASKEGTLAHAIAEFKLKSLFNLENNCDVRALRDNPLYQDEMEDFTQDYVDYITKIADGTRKQVFIEQRVMLDKWVKESFGTCDCVVIDGETLHIIDLKYGKGVEVNAYENTQLKLYALGCYEKFKHLSEFKKVVLHIVQPRLYNNSHFNIDLKDLLIWGEYIKPIANIAFKGDGEFKPSVENCRFCKARTKCKARADFNVSMFDYIDKELSDEDIAKYLRKGEDVSNWLNDLKEYALKQCLKGNNINGYKAVIGRVTRAFTDETVAIDRLIKGGISKDDLYETKTLSLAKIEKAVGKSAFYEMVGDLITKKNGQPVLATIDDKREEIKEI